MSKDCNSEQSNGKECTCKNDLLFLDERRYSSLHSSNKTVIFEKPTSSIQNAYPMNNYPQRNYYSNPNCQTLSEREYDYDYSFYMTDRHDDVEEMNACKSIMKNLLVEE